MSPEGIPCGRQALKEGRKRPEGEKSDFLPNPCAPSPVIPAQGRCQISFDPFTRPQWTRACMVAFRKQLLPKFTRPLGGNSSSAFESGVLDQRKTSAWKTRFQRMEGGKGAVSPGDSPQVRGSLALTCYAQLLQQTRQPVVLQRRLLMR